MNTYPEPASDRHAQLNSPDPTCGCCEGLETQTPLSTANRPGLPALSYRMGTHASFLESMLVSLSRKLTALTTRQRDDLSIALLDSWATIGDVLTFYQERIANEGYIRTAIELRSVLELARLVGYRLRPGVAASVFLAYELEKGEKSAIPKGSRVQSVPGPGELPQSFETDEELLGWYAWNNLRPRQTRPLVIVAGDVAKLSAVYLKSLTPNLQTNSPLLFVFNESQVPRYVDKVEPQFTEGRTNVILQSVAANAQEAKKNIGSLLAALNKAPARLLPARQYLAQGLKTSLGAKAQASLSLLAAGKPRLKRLMTSAMSHAVVTEKVALRDVHALRMAARPFGANAPLMPVYNENGIKIGESEWPLGDYLTIQIEINPSNATLVDAHITLFKDNQTELHDLSIAVFETEITTKVEFSLRYFTLVIHYWQGGVNFEFEGLEYQNIKFELSENIQNKIYLNFSTNGVPKIVPPRRRLQFRDGFQVEILHSGRLIELAGETVRLPSIKNYIQYTIPLPVEDKTLLTLDTINEKITPDSWVFIEGLKDGTTMILQVSQATTLGKNAYGLCATTTQLTLKGDWLTPQDLWLSDIRKATVYCQSEALELAEEPIDPVIYSVGCVVGENGSCGHTDWIELDGWYPEVEAGRWLIVAGERTDIVGTSGVMDSEAVLLAEVRQGVSQVDTDPDHEPSEADADDRKGDQLHTFIRLEKPLEYCYKRDTVVIYGNVVKASHGETRSEVLGSGDASQPFKQYPLKVSPVTYLADPNPRGAISTLAVRVNDVLWHEKDAWSTLHPGDRAYLTKTDDLGNTTVIFGDGQNGLRPPTGVQNLTAQYRSGIGKCGNVAAGKLTLLATRPLHVKGVTNPQPATGGANADTPDQARRNAPLAVMALDRLVSVQDYADFARTFAGIGKTSAIKLSDGKQQVVHLTIAGLDDIPIDENSALFVNLHAALLRYGDPRQPLVIALRELQRLVLEARVFLHPDYRWEKVKPRLEALLLDTFSFDRRELGQDAVLSELLGCLQAAEGVVYVDVDKFGAIPELGDDDQPLLPAAIADRIAHLEDPYDSPRVIANLAQMVNGKLKPAQIVYFTPDVPATLVLNLGNPGG